MSSTERLSGAGAVDHPIRVLVVDDHAMLTQALAQVLGARDEFDVVAVAGTAADAERLAATHEPDVVVLDYRLPDGDGASAGRRMRAKRPEVEVVLLTGDASDQVLQAAVEAGFAGVVTKDQAIDEIADAIRAAHAGEASIPPALLGRLLRRMRPGADDPRSLTPREQEVLQLLTEGLSNQQIADRLVLSVSTVRNHVQNILRKLDAHSRLEAVTIGVRRGMTRYPR